MGNKRDHFRISFVDLPGRFALLRVAERDIPLRFIPTEILNVSGGGVMFSVDIDLPIRLGITARVQFILAGQEFDLSSRLVRKTDTLTCYEYSAEFEHVPEGDRRRLVEALNRIQITRVQVAAQV